MAILHIILVKEYDEETYEVYADFTDGSECDMCLRELQSDGVYEKVLVKALQID